MNSTGVSGTATPRTAIAMNGGMKSWSPDKLQRIVVADDLHIAPFRADGTTCGTPTWISGAVAVDGDLYVRAYHGPDSRWYQSAMRQRAGRIIAAGMTREVAFEAVDGSINDLVDDAYEAKYRSSRYLRPMLGASARSATVRVVPRVTDSR